MLNKYYDFNSLNSFYELFYISIPNYILSLYKIYDSEKYIKEDLFW